MSELSDLIEELLVAGVELSLVDGKVRVRAADGVLTPDRLALLRAHRDALPDLLGRHRFTAPMSVGQEGLWFIQRSAPESSAYNVGVALRIASSAGAEGSAPADPRPKIRRALQRLVDRHMLLRARYFDEAGSPKQVIDAHQRVAIDERDLVGATPEELERAASEFHLRPFDLAAEGGFRAALFACAPGACLLVLCVHHVAVDGWSIRMLGDEFLRLFAADGEANPLPPARHTYLHFVRRQQEVLATRGEALKRTAIDALAGAPMLLDLATDEPRPPHQTFRGRTHQRTLDPALVASLRALGRAEGATLYMIFLAAFEVLLHRYTGQEDFCVGSAAALREREEFAGLFGYMVNAIVLRAQISASDPPSFGELLAETRRRSLDALDRQEYPFPRLAKQLLRESERDPSRPPVFQVMFSYQRAQALGDAALRLMTGATVEIAGATIRQVPLTQAISEVELILEITEHAAGVELGIRYNADLFHADTIARMAGHLEVLLAGVIADPRTSVAELPLLTAAEETTLIDTWNRNDGPFSSEATLHGLFEAQVDRAPEATAIVDYCGLSAGGSKAVLSYRELEQRANQVAHRLLRAGVRPDDLVALCMERSADFIVALLGVMKSGAAYVSLDPEHPERRLAALVDDAGAAVLITRRRLLKLLPERPAATVIDFSAGFADEATTRLETDVGAGNLAAVLYTSGSTGEPNGALLEHRGLVNSVEATFDILECDPTSRLVHVLSFNFDGALAKLFWMLGCGGSVYLAPRDGDYLGPGLIELINRESITHTFFPPAILAALPDAAMPTLQTILVGGERCTPEIAKRWAPGRRLKNIYGPTETSILVTSWPIVDDGQPPPIGRLIPNIRGYVLDRNRRLVPAGVPGELYIGGVGVGRGYHNRPEATARKFVDDPFAPGTIYRTGDLVRQRAVDGEPPVLEFIRRLDNLVKLRGYRLELGEIEAVLNASPRVRASAVTVITDKARQLQRLVAYVTPSARTRERDRELAHVASWDATYDQMVATDLDTVKGRVSAKDGPERPEAAAATDISLDLRGWKDSYTGEDIDPAEMRVWAESTVARLLALRPRDVLEIGTGTGMLLARIAPESRRYRGTDLAAYAIEQAAALRRELGGLDHVEVTQQPAHDFSGLDGEPYDTVILNSVVQYFPSADYLLEVLEGLLARVDASASIFLGDIRSLPLLATYHASVERFQAPEATARELSARVQRALRAENELVLDPRFFTELRARFPQIVDVEVVPKRGAFSNELTKYRYDVTLRIGDAPEGPVPERWRDAADEDWTFARLERWLDQAPAGAVLGLRDVANARLSADNDLRRWLADDGDAAWSRPSAAPPDALDPEELFALEAAGRCRVALSWAAGRDDGSFDLAIVAGADGPAPRIPLGPPQGTRTQALASDPLRGERERELVVGLRKELREALPSYLIPAAIIVLPALPININGKVDRRALPEPDRLRDPELPLAPPTTDAERGLVEIWSELLGLDQLSVDDNFFELGGDSLLAVRAMARVPERFGVELPVRTLIERPTIRDIARHVEMALAALELVSKPTTSPSRGRQRSRI